MNDVEGERNDNNSTLTEKYVNPEESFEDKLEIDKLKEKYGEFIGVISYVEKENKSAKKKKSKKKRKISDPVVKNIAELMSNGLKIISPDKPYKGLTLEDTPVSETMDENIKSNCVSLENPSEEHTTDDKLINEENVVEENVKSPVYKRILKDADSDDLFVDSEESQDAFEKKKDAKKKKRSRLSTIKSPKGKKFKDCSQQSKLNGFFQIKSPTDKNTAEKIFDDTNVACSRLKLSTSLFRSPRASKVKRDVEKKCEEETLQTEQVIDTNKESESTKNVLLKEVSVQEDVKPRPVKKRGRPKKNADIVSTPKSVRKTNSEEDVLLNATTDLKEELKSPVNAGKVSEDKKVTPTRSDNSIEPQTTPQRNAFQFMMGQRNKVIGSNSPGKVSPPAPPVIEDAEEVERKKERLAKRKKQLSEWNEVKGGVKRKMEEDDREECTDRILQSRAKLMKEMLTGEIVNAVENGTDCDVIIPKDTCTDPATSVEEIAVKNETVKTVKKSRNKKKNVEDASEGSVVGNSPQRKRKRRTVRIESTSESSNDSTFMQNVGKRQKLDTKEGGLLNFVSVTPKDDTSAVEVKKTKSTRKKTNLSVKKDKIDELTDDELSKMLNEHNQGMLSKGLNGVKFSSLKNKLLLKIKNPLGKKLVEEEELNNEEELVEEVELIKEELVEEVEDIRRSARKKKVVLNYTEDYLDSGEVKGGKSDSGEVKGGKSKKDEKEKKVAPIFLKSSPKPKEDPAVVQARLEFLRSGVPTMLKKMVEKQQSIEEEIDFNAFPSISHVQQKTSDPSPFWNLPPALLDLKEYENKVDINTVLAQGEVTRCNTNNPLTMDLPKVTKNLRYKTIIEEIKSNNTNYPVYKSFRLLTEKAGRSFEAPPPKTPTPVKRKRGRPKKKSAEDDDVVLVESVVETNVNPADSAMWTEKYRPRSSQEIIGNYKSVTGLREWLNGWIEYSKEVRAGKRRNRSDSSDFESTDGDSRDSVKLPCNTMVLQGPLGCGKSTSVYAVCQELGVNVLEINASSKRTGKKLLQEMQEATQSHQVGKKEINPLTAFLHKDKIPKEIREAKAKSDSKMCILLIEDADIVFDQDEAFIYALNQLILTSKRPIILTTSNVDCNHMQKFTSQYPVLDYQQLTARDLSVWLQVLCVLEGVYLDEHSIGELLEWNKGDVRRTMLELQFYVQSGGVNKSSSSLFGKYSSGGVFDGFIYEDDQSSILNKFKEDTGEDIVMQNGSVKSLVANGRIQLPLNLGLLWWNLHDLLDLNYNNELSKDNQMIIHLNKVVALTNANLNRENENGEAELHNANGQFKTLDCDKKKVNDKKLMEISDVYDALSFTDVLYRSEGFDVESEPFGKRTEGGFKEGLNLKEDTVAFKTERNFSQEIARFLIERSCDVFNPNFEGAVNMAMPSSSEKSRRIAQNECERQFLTALPSSYSVHRSTFAVDYFPTMRTICRTESARSLANKKRGNRFYNYLKTLNVDLNNTTMKTACNTMINTCRK